MSEYTPINPTGVLPCGATDDLLPVPVHYDCRECRKVALGILAARTPPAAKTVPPEQSEFSFMRTEEK